MALETLRPFLDVALCPRPPDLEPEMEAQTAVRVVAVVQTAAVVTGATRGNLIATAAKPTPMLPVDGTAAVTEVEYATVIRMVRETERGIAGATDTERKRRTETANAIGTRTVVTEIVIGTEIVTAETTRTGIERAGENATPRARARQVEQYPAVPLAAPNPQDIARHPAEKKDWARGGGPPTTRSAIIPPKFLPGRLFLKFLPMCSPTGARSGPPAKTAVIVKIEADGLRRMAMTVLPGIRTGDAAIVTAQKSIIVLKGCVHFVESHK